MKRSTALLTLVLITCSGFGAYAALRQDAGMQMPKPTPEHAMLRKSIGTWDANVTTYMGSQAMTSKGSMTVQPLGDFWTLGNYEGDMGGMKFQGHNIEGYSVDKKKYVSVWVDSMGGELTLGEGTYDAATKTMKSTLRSAMGGQPMNWSTVTTYPDNDTMIMNMAMLAADGKETPWMKLEYKRKHDAKGAK